MSNFFQYFKSIVDQDTAAVVVCDVGHNIVYMNPAAIAAHAKRGGNLVGKSIFDCHNERSCQIIREVSAWFAESPENNRVHTYYNEKQNRDVYMIALRDESGEYIGYYEKHEYRDKDNTPFYEFDKK